MSRVEENLALIKQTDDYRKAGVCGTDTPNKIGLLTLTVLEDISRSLAVIADNLETNRKM